MTTLGVPKMSSQQGAPPGSPRAWVSAETIQLIGMESQREGFWPGLCSLKCNIGWEIVPFISLFLAPTITDLDLTLPRDQNNRLLQPTLSLFSHACRRLRSLRMDVDTSSPESGAEMGRLISASRNTLHRIDIRTSTPPEIFPVIFNLPLLRSLVLQEPRLPDQLPPEILPPLETIDFNGNHGPNVTQFLRLSVRRLVTVSIRCGGVIQLPTFLDSLCDANATMNRLYLSPVAALDRSSITILRTFTNLTSLVIRCVCESREMNWPCSFQLTNEGLLDLGGALPHVRSLDLGQGCHRACHVTFKSLIGLSRMCRNLETLSIRVDFASIVDGSDQPGRSNTNIKGDSVRPQRERNRMWILAVGNSPLPDTPRCEWIVALALVTIFPSIQYVFSNCSSEMNRRWNGVWGDILVCQKIFNITQTEGKRLGSHRLFLVVSIPIRSIQTPLWFRKLVKGSHRPQVTSTTGIAVGCGTGYVGVSFK